MLAAPLLMLFALPPPAADPKDEAIRLARQVLVESLGPEAESSSVERVEPVDWPDSGLGCVAAKGEVREPVLTPGFRVVLRFSDKSHEVHVGGARARACPAGAGANAFVTAALQVSTLARKDLAGRLGVETKDVRIQSIKPTTWPHRTLTCAPSKDANAIGEPAKGFVVLLQAGGKDYTYNADTEHAVYCPES